MYWKIFVHPFSGKQNNILIDHAERHRIYFVEKQFSRGDAEAQRTTKRRTQYRDNICLKNKGFSSLTFYFMSFSASPRAINRCFYKDTMIRPAKQNEAETLTRISFASKGYWNYPEEYFEIWKDELTITPEYIEKNTVFVYKIGTAVVGYYSIVELPENIEVSGIIIPKGFRLEHMFIEPGHIGKGIGTAMFSHLKDRYGEIGISELGILSDPHAKGFYEKMGCRYLRDLPSTIENRTTPHLTIAF